MICALEIEIGLVVCRTVISSFAPRASCAALGGVRPLDRVDVRVPEALHVRRQDLIGSLAGVLARDAEHGRPVDRMVDGLAQVQLRQRRPARVEGEVGRVDAGVDEVAAGAALLDPELARQVVVRGRREAELVVVDLAGPDLEQALVDVGVGGDHDPVRVRGAVPLVEPVPLEHDLAADLPAGDPIRACGGIDADALGVDRHARLHRGEEGHRHLGEEGRIRPEEADRQRLTIRDDTGDRARLAFTARVGADDVVQERDRG